MADKAETEQETDETADATPSGKARFVKPLAWVLGAIMVATTLSVLTMPEPETPDPEKVAAEKKAKPIKEPKQLRPDLQHAGSLARARRALREGNAALAYQDFQRFANNSDKTVDQNLLFEISLCCESVGNTATASRLYEKLASSTNQKLSTAARLGLARVHFRSDKYEAVETLLAPGLIADDFANNPALTAEGEYLRALSLANIAIPEQRMSLLLEPAVIGGSPKWSVQDIMADLRSKPVKPQPQKEVLQIRGKGIDAVVSIQLKKVPLRRLTDEIINQCGLEPAWSVIADQTVRRQNTPVKITSKSASVVLDLLSSKADLMWFEKDGKVLIKAGTESTSAERQAWNRDRARRALWGAITAFPESRMSHYAVLSLGNLDQLTDPTEAIARYDECLRQTRVSSVRMAAEFNRSKVAMRQNKFDDAAVGFDSAAQFGNGTIIAAVSLLYHAKLAMEIGEHRRATSPLLRAVAYLDISSEAAAKVHRWTDRDDALAMTALTLSVAWFMNDNPMAANENLMRHRKVLKDERFRDATAFLSALATYRQAKTEPERLAEGRSLVAALTQMKPGLLFTSVGTALIGQAWSELGLSAQTVTIYEKVLPDVRTPWLKKQVLHGLLDYHLTVRNEKRVQQLLLELRKITADDFEVEIALAEQSVRLGRSDIALKQCRALLENPDANKPAVLTVMGEAYQRTGDFRNAALCFAGMLPRVAASSGAQ